jgi:hypothetical protein
MKLQLNDYLEQFFNSYTLNTQGAMVKINIIAYRPTKAHRVSTGISLLFL